MRLFLKILNIITIIVLFSYIFLTYQFYSLLVLITGNWTPSIYAYSKIPYYLLWISAVINIVLCIIIYVRNKRVISTRKIKLPVKTGIFVVCFALITMFFVPRFEFLYYDEATYPKSIRYDGLFVCNYFYSNEGDYLGGYGDAKYLYIPIVNKMVYIDSTGVSTYSVTYLKDNKVKIGSVIYTIKSSWYDES